MIIDGCKRPSSRKRRGTCQTVTATPRIRVDTSGERVLCSPGRAKPRQPGSSPSAPSPGLTRRTAKTRRMVLTEPKASEGALDEGGDERRACHEGPERYAPPPDRVGQDEERDDRVMSHRRHRANSFLPPQNGGRCFRAAMMSPSDLRCIFNKNLFTELR